MLVKGICTILLLTLLFCSETKLQLDEDEGLTVLQERASASAYFGSERDKHTKNIKDKITNST